MASDDIADFIDGGVWDDLPEDGNLAQSQYPGWCNASALGQHFGTGDALALLPGQCYGDSMFLNASTFESINSRGDMMAENATGLDMSMSASSSLPRSMTHQTHGHASSLA
ncbi:hypothetical protein PG994_006014 [Apiospora phragmitis]|uniref:Uncharacterized protein n=1 Tax=Apiospora phragmitis TaxID=2905665 RepID=A0ABR1VDY3_9PEZI